MSALALPHDALIVFLDETGVEDFSDPKFPVFGRGAMAATSGEYRRLQKAWRKLKREYLGGAKKQFHAVDFEQSRPTLRQINAINRFVALPFERYAAVAHRETSRPDDVDGHLAVSMVMTNFIIKFVAKHDAPSVALVFEASERGNSLVERDFHFAPGTLVNSRGKPVDYDGYFMPKASMEPGLEIADLIVHTAGRQERRRRAGQTTFNLDFTSVFQRIEDKGLVQYRSILSIDGEAGGRTAKSEGF
jgi:hypothetical protein